MSKPDQPDRWGSVVAEAAPVAEATPAIAKPAVAVKLELGGDEIIQFSIRPSVWFVPLVSFKWVLAIGLLAALLAVVSAGNWTSQIFVAYQVLAGLAALRIAIATLQWASRLYVLTNRRVMRFTGVLSVHVAECPLAKISAADLLAAWYEHPLRLGTIRMSSRVCNPGVVVWEQLAHPAEVHDLLTRAIRKAQMKD